MTIISILSDYFDNFKWDDIEKLIISLHNFEILLMFIVVLEYKGYIVYLRNSILYVIRDDFYDIFSIEKTFNLRDMMDIWYELTSPFKRQYLI